MESDTIKKNWQYFETKKFQNRNVTLCFKHVQCSSFKGTIWLKSSASEHLSRKQTILGECLTLNLHELSKWGGKIALNRCEQNQMDHTQISSWNYCRALEMTGNLLLELGEVEKAQQCLGRWIPLTILAKVHKIT